MAFKPIVVELTPPDPETSDGVIVLCRKDGVLTISASYMLPTGDEKSINIRPALIASFPSEVLAAMKTLTAHVAVVGAQLLGFTE